jgi:hypothetical protein
MVEKYRYGEYGYEQDYNQTVIDNGTRGTGNERPGGYDDADVFGHEEGHDVSILRR